MLLNARRVTSFTVLLLVLSILPALPVGADPAQPAPQAQPQVSTPVAVGNPRAARASQSDAAPEAVATRRRLPEAGTAEVPTSGVTTLVGGLPLSLRGAVGAGEDFLSETRNRPGDFSSGPASVRVQLAGREATAAAGVLMAQLGKVTRRSR